MTNILYYLDAVLVLHKTSTWFCSRLRLFWHYFVFILVLVNFVCGYDAYKCFWHIVTVLQTSVGGQGWSGPGRGPSGPLVQATLHLTPFVLVTYSKIHFGSQSPRPTGDDGHTGSGGHGFPKIR